MVFYRNLNALSRNIAIFVKPIFDEIEPRKSYELITSYSVYSSVVRIGL